MKRRVEKKITKCVVSMMLAGWIAIPSAFSGWAAETDQSEYTEEENLDNESVQDEKKMSSDDEPVYLKEELSLLQKHQQIEAELQVWYENSDAKTLENAVVHQDLYEMAPLTGVVFFETDQPETVTVTVHGKTEDADISYVTEKETHHEIQIFGLYPDYSNMVTVEAESGEFREFIIETEAVPEAMTRIEKTESKGEQISDNLFYVCDKWRTVYDQYGDIRWYMTGINAAFSGIDEVDSENHCFWFSTEASSASMATVYCVSFTGKLLGKYFNLGKSAHHDAALLPDGKLLYLSKWRTRSSELSILDPETGKLEQYMDPQELFDESLGSLEYSTSNHEWDFLHINAVEYIPENNSLLLSFRNQHMIMNVDYDTQNINWVLTPAYTTLGNQTEAIQTVFSDVLILPEEQEEFEWFYSQHSPKVISYDPETEVYDIILFDNGTDRFLASESGNAGINREKYSRLVRYQINAKEKTVKQIYEFGQDDPELYSDQCGSAQYIAKNDHYIGNFPCLETADDKRTSVVTESDSDGNLIAKYILENIPDGSYRTMTFDVDTFVSTENMISKEWNYTEAYHLDGKHWEIADYDVSQQNESYQVNEIILTDHGLTIRGNVEGVGEKEKLKMRFLAIDSEGKQYAMPLICYHYNKFYMPGLDMKSLPKDTYRLAIYMEKNGEKIGYKTISYLYSEEIASASESEDEREYTLVENTTNWEVEIFEDKFVEELRTIVPVTQYDLSIDNVEYVNSPQDEMVYFLLNLKVKKSGSGSKAFSWKNVSLTDVDGNTYTRIDDIFLEDHLYDRMSGTDIKMGSKTGWICFEIPKTQMDETFTFEYQGSDGERLSYIIN